MGTAFGNVRKGVVAYDLAPLLFERLLFGNGSQLSVLRPAPRGSVSVGLSTTPHHDGPETPPRCQRILGAATPEKSVPASWPDEDAPA